MSFRARIDKPFDRTGFVMWLMNDRGRDTYIAKPIRLEFELRPEGFKLPEPTLELPPEDAIGLIQALADALAENDWINRQTKSEGKVEAIKEHLKDMREMSNRLMKMVEDKL